MKAILKIALSFFSIALFLTGCERREPIAQDDQHNEPAAESANKAPDFTLTDHAGKTHTLADYLGKTVVLEWINPECPFVLRHHETNTTMIDLANAYAERGVVWLAVNSTSYFDHARNKATAEKWNLPYPILNDQDGKVSKAYGATRTPELVVIDKGGSIVYHGAIDDDPRGNKDDVKNYVQQALDELLAGKPVSVAKTDPYGCTIKRAN
jgi:peroxiredoxin